MKLKLSKYCKISAFISEEFINVIKIQIDAMKRKIYADLSCYAKKGNKQVSAKPSLQ